MSGKNKKDKKTKVMDKEVVYGPNPIMEMLKAKKRKLYSIYTKKPLPKAWEKIQKYLPPVVPNTQYVDKSALDGIARSPDHKGIIALVSPFKYAQKMFDPAKKPLILLLDSVQDVGNLGAILRSAYCSGVDGVILCENRAALITPAVLSASAGYAEYLDIYCVPSVGYAVKEIREAGYTLYMAVMNGQNAATVEYKRPACLVIGNEASGISKEVQKYGELITIPQRSPDISYNASVAAGILLFLLSGKK
ncbi:MAG: RNA methyltransferase [bacterium]